MNLKGHSFLKKHAKSVRYDDIDFDTVKKFFWTLHLPLLHVFDLSIRRSIFSDKVKIARVRPNQEFLLTFVIDEVFDTVDHEILISNLEKYGFQGKNIQWFRSYLSNSEQLAKYGNLNATFEHNVWYISRFNSWAIFTSYLREWFTTCIKNLDQNTFADNTNLFYSHQDINTLSLL